MEGDITDMLLMV